MAVDYDLVILGGTALARYAAWRAARLKARVALVEPVPPPLLEWADAMGHALAHLTRHHHQAGQMAWLMGTAEPMELPPLHWERSLQWSQKVAQSLINPYSTAQLAAAGVDVICGRAEFVRRPQVGVVAEGRLLRSRRYLIAPGCQSMVPAIAGLERANPLTLERLWQPNSTVAIGHPLVILGGDGTALELAQAFHRLGIPITLVLDSPDLLPQADPELSRLLQLHLEMEGMEVHLNSSVSQVRLIDHQKWVQVGTQAIAAHDILLATGRRPALEGLNLEAVQLTPPGADLPVNHRMQTANPTIYACGEAVGHRSTSALAQVGTRIAVKNALFFPLFSLPRPAVPQVLHTDPELAWVGLTEPQAREQYGDRLTILRHPITPVARAQMQGHTTGMGKFILHPQGRLLGAHLLAPGAGEMVATLALALQRRLSMSALARLPIPPLTLSTLLHQTGEEWSQGWGDRHPRWLDWLEEWFDGRRDRTR